jgi:hypothetical protein
MPIGKAVHMLLATLPSLRQRMLQKELVLSLVASLVCVSIIFANSNTLNLFLVGFVGLFVYLFVNGRILGKAFFGDERRFVRFGFGLFLFIALMAFTGILALFIFRIEIWNLLGMLFAAVATFLLSVFFGNSESQNEPDEDRKFFSNSRYIIPIYGLYISFFLFSLYILSDVRSGWIEGPIWNAIPSIFLQTYFIATAFLAGMVILPGRISVKLVFIILHSVFSLSILLLVLYPGIVWYDPWYEMAQARVVLLETVNLFERASLGVPFFIRSLNSHLRGLGDHVLLVTFTEALRIDMYWIFVFLLPLMWGFFVPLTSYKMTRMLGGSKEISVFAAFLTISNLSFLAWGKLSAGGSLGILFFFLLVYLLMRFLLLHENRAFLLAILVLATSVSTHVLPGVLSVSVMFLALAVKVYERIRPKFPRVAGLGLFTSFILATFLLPFMVIIRGVLIPALGTPAWSVKNLLSTSVWEFVFGVSEESPIYDGVLYNVFWVLSLVGIVHVMKRKERFNSTLSFFMLLAFGVAFIDFRILNYAISNNIFGPGRVSVFIDVLGLPFAAIVIYNAANSLLGTASRVRSSLRWKNVLVGMLVCVGLSAWVLGAVYETYEYYTSGLLPTSLEVEALKYIDQHADRKYIVLAPNRMVVIGLGFFGLPNPEKTFLSLGKAGVPFDPSLSFMFESMRTAGVDVGYYVATSTYAHELDRTVAEASEVFRLLKVFNDDNGVIYVFDYKIPPVPSVDASDVMAFYWDTPSSYILQNNLMRITINANTSTLAVMNFWGDIYESIELGKTLVGGYPVGNLTSIEYFNSTNGEWVKWDPSKELLPAVQFQFRLNFENDTLAGIFRGREPLVDLRWESGRESTLSLQVGDFTRLYIPGLVEGQDSHDILSQEYSFFYTRSLTNGVVLQPLFERDTSYSTLTYSQILGLCNFTRTPAKTWYELYVNNTFDVEQWAYVEVWLPDEVHPGSPPLWYSIDEGKTWVFPRYDPETLESKPIRTVGGLDVNWIYTIPRYVNYPENEKPTKFWAYPYKDSVRGGELPESYTDSGGAQNRILFGFDMPPGEKILVRLGISTWYVDPLMVTYVFRDSEDVGYGLRNMEDSLIEFYNWGFSESVGGLAFAQLPTSLAVTQDETGNIDSILITIPANTGMSLLAEKEINTTIDEDGNGVPDLIES